MSELTLYHAIPSRGLVAHWMLEELGEPFTTRVLDLEQQEHKTDEFLRINPMGRVPVLTHGNTVVTETAAIVAYLADAFPHKNLGVALDSPARGEYLRWLHFGPGSAEPAIIWSTLGELASQAEYQPFADIDSVAKTLCAAVDGKQFVIEDRFTAADVMLGSTLMWGLHMMPVLPQDKRLLSYWAGLASRPAWQKVQATMPAPG